MDSTSKNEISSFITRNNIVIDVSKEFVDLVGYSKDELVGKPVEHVCKLLRIHKEKIITGDNVNFKCFLVTKYFEAKEVNFFTKKLVSNERVYFINGNVSDNINDVLSDNSIVIEQLFKNNEIGIVIHSFPELILLRANQRYLDLANKHFKEMNNSVGTPISERIPNYKGSSIEGIWSYIMETGEPYHNNEFKYNHYERGDTYWDLSIIPIYVEGKPKYLIETCIDVTEKVLNRKLIDEQVEIMEQKEIEFETIIQNMSEALIVFDKDGNRVKVNKSANNIVPESYTKYRNNKYFVNTTEFFHIDGELIPTEELPTNRMLRGEKVVNYKLIIKNEYKDIYCEINAVPTYDYNGNFLGGICWLRDVSEQQRYEEILKNHNNFLNRIIHNIDLPILRLSVPSLVIIDINQPAVKIAKAKTSNAESISSLKGKEIKNFNNNFFNEDDFSRIDKVLKENKMAYLKEKRYEIDGNEAYGNIIIDPMFSLNGEMEELFMAMIDVTSEIQANKVMEQTLQLQDEFFSNISHELRTPINVIFAAIQLIEYNMNNKKFNERDQKKYLKMMKQNSYRLLKLVNNIIDISKIESGYYNVTLINYDIINLVEEITLSVTEFAKCKGVEIIFDTDVEERIIACDPDIIERIMLNLISNALKWTTTGDKIFVKLRNAEDKVFIHVEDTGVGIPEEKQKMIFERFKQVDKSFTRKSEGSGIGLSLVKLFVEALGGNVSVRSKVNKGSEFIVELNVNIVKDNLNESLDKSNMQEISDRISIEFSDIYA